MGMTHISNRHIPSLDPPPPTPGHAPERHGTRATALVIVGLLAAATAFTVLRSATIQEQVPQLGLASAVVDGPAVPLSSCTPSLADGDGYTVQLESVARGAASRLAAAVDTHGVCALSPALRPGTESDRTPVVVAATFTTLSAAVAATCGLADELRRAGLDPGPSDLAIRHRGDDGLQIRWIDPGAANCN